MNIDKRRRKMGTVGVIIGRFQSPYLHAGHQHLISEVMARHEHVCILIGTREGQPTSRDPLEFALRQAMLAELYPQAIIKPLSDHPSNEVWSERVDEAVRSEFPEGEAVLYCSRDGFREAYSGKLGCEVITEVPGFSATALRQSISARATEDFRAGVIYGAVNRYPTSYQVVDIAILHTTEPKVLLAKKSQDGDKWRFVGGFVDPQDKSLEMAAKREAREETGNVSLDEFRYLGSARIDDSRYRRQPDQVMTALFRCYFIFGRPEARDDIKEVRWHSLKSLPEVLIDSHQGLGQMLLAELNKKQPERKEEVYVNA